MLEPKAFIFLCGFAAVQRRWMLINVADLASKSQKKNTIEGSNPLPTLRKYPWKTRVVAC